MEKVLQAVYCSSYQWYSLGRDQNQSTFARVQSSSGPEGIDFEMFVSNIGIVEHLWTGIYAGLICLMLQKVAKLTLTAANIHTLSVFSDLWICSTENTNVFKHIETHCDIDDKSKQLAPRALVWNICLFLWLTAWYGSPEVTWANSNPYIQLKFILQMCSHDVQQNKYSALQLSFFINMFEKTLLLPKFK